MEMAYADFNFSKSKNVGLKGGGGIIIFAVTAVHTKFHLKFSVPTVLVQLLQFTVFSNMRTTLTLTHLHLLMNSAM
jgi:hypothetical protein